MTRIIFDIETVGMDWEGLDDLSKRYFLKFADTPEKEEEARQSLSFYPLTAEIVCIALLSADSHSGFVLFQKPDGTREKFAEQGITFISGTEKEILKMFWRLSVNTQQLISFNGRLFDGPFLMLRSAIHQISAQKNLLPYRYSAGGHIDLADQLTFYDAMRRRFPLHMWCRAFGIPSPKEGEANGQNVKDLYKEGRYKKIARYCLGDTYATKQLFEYWEKYLKF